MVVVASVELQAATTAVVATITAIVRHCMRHNSFPPDHTIPPRCVCASTSGLVQAGDCFAFWAMSLTTDSLASVVTSPRWRSSEMSAAGAA